MPEGGAGFDSMTRLSPGRGSAFLKAIPYAAIPLGDVNLAE